jgi:hypothetical protein
MPRSRCCWGPGAALGFDAAGGGVGAGVGAAAAGALAGGGMLRAGSSGAFANTGGGGTIDGAPGCTACWAVPHQGQKFTRLGIRRPHCGPMQR